MCRAERDHWVLIQLSWVLVVMGAGVCRAQPAQMLVMLSIYTCARQCRAAIFVLILPAAHMT